MPHKSKASSSGQNMPPSPVLISGEALAVVSSTSSQMSEESIRKLVDQVAIPAIYDWLKPSSSQFANAPPLGYLTVYASQLTSGLRFPLHPLLRQLSNNFLGVFASKLTTGECFFYLSPRPGLTFLKDKPSFHGAWKTRFFFVHKPEWDIPLAWGSSLNPLPYINLGEIKRRMTDVGLVSHEFKAKAILEEDLLIVTGIHPTPDRYEGPLDTYSRLRIMMTSAVVRKFIPEDVPAIPPSPSARSVSSTPSEAPSASVPRATSPPPPQSYAAAFPHGTPIIEVSTSPDEGTPFQTPLEVHPSSPIPPPVEAVSSSQKRPRIEEVPIEDPPAGEASELLVFSAQATNRADVELLSSRSVAGIGNFLLTQISAIPAVVAAMRMDEEGAQTRDTEAKLREEIEAFRNQLVEKEGQIVTLTMENEAVKASIVQAYTRGRGRGGLGDDFV
ncbi:hypothetical protein Salat_1902700 [Sesamum alatum]|uniref:Uncharacterized protein n=1 Tax=Sesamum alatum TaxID=300844 RepID=A0AAE2CIH1_9LAMI|nr:hypothetical protein Salat_1902700 [Sesamum alatum]